MNVESEPVQPHEPPQDIAKAVLENGTSDGDDPTPLSLSIEDIVAVILFWATAIIIFLQFFTRYVLNNSFSWTEEIARYLLIGLTFVGAAAVVRRRAHINLTYFADKLPSRGRRLLETGVQLISIALFGSLTWYASQVAGLMGNQPMTSVNLPMGIVYWTVTVGFAAMTLRSLQVLYFWIRLKPE